MKILSGSNFGFFRHTLQRRQKSGGRCVTTTDPLQSKFDVIQDECQIDFAAAGETNVASCRGDEARQGAISVESRPGIRQ